MLKSLTIKNYKLIKEAQFLPEKGFTVLTGETGAGKSTLMGALSLLLGERADSSIWKDLSEKCSVEAVFEHSSKAITAFFQENELDDELEILLRREISANGKSRAFINDTPVTLDQLQQLTNLLVDVHGQHENLDIAEETNQLEALDIFAETEKEILDYQSAYLLYKETQKQRLQLEERQEELQKNLDYNTFLFSELNELPLEDLDLKELETELGQLENIDTIRKNIASILNKCNADTVGAMQLLGLVKKEWEQISSFGDDFLQLFTQFNSGFVEIQDALSELENKTDFIQDDPQRLDLLTKQINKLNDLFRKHHLGTISELLDLKLRLQKDIQLADSSEQDLQKLQKKEEEALIKAQKLAEQLSKKREKNKDKLAKTLQQSLLNLGMPKATFSVEMQKKELTLQGQDKIQFLFSANVGIKPAPVYKAASGGEYSRIMLALKSLLAGKTELPTLFFDEIDTGVSGQVAMQVATELKKLAQKHQVICITHMPQVAAKADKHYHLKKEHKKDRSETQLVSLNKKTQVEEIARMIGGDSFSAAALQSAQELMDH